MVRQRSGRQTPLYLDQTASERCDGTGGTAIRNGEALISSLSSAIARSARDQLSMTRAPHRQGYSSPPNDMRSRIGTRELGSSAQIGTGLAATAGNGRDRGRSGGASVVVGARESRVHGEGKQEDGRLV